MWHVQRNKSSPINQYRLQNIYETENPLGFKTKVVINPYEKTNAILIFDPLHSYLDTFILFR